MHVLQKLYLTCHCVIFVCQVATAETNERVDFNSQIRPLLSDNCFFCHGPDATHREGGLRLDQAETAFAAGDSGLVAIVPGKPEESEVLQRVLSGDPDMLMPKPESGKQLSAQEIELLRCWIEQGAVWEEHWAYRAPVHSVAPVVHEKNWPLNIIDRYILSRLEKESLTPAQDADPVTLVRRLHLDLTGLPPEPEVVDHFLQSNQSDRYERLVDRLLASPQFGERMAMYWLDLVRYADTVGYHGDQDHNISPYRDYVVDSFNENLPLNRFTHEQLAGDLLANEVEGDIDAETRLKVASGYNRLLQTSHEGGVQKKEYLAIYAADRVRNLSSVWMGATMGCCQCHDHKFDPFTARDFYAMVAFFADIDEDKTFAGSNTLPTKREPEMFVFSADQRKRIASIEREQRVFHSAAEKDNEVIEALNAERRNIEQQTRKTMITVAVPPRTIRILPRGNWLDDTGEVVQPAIPEFLGRLENGERRANRLDLAYWLTDVQSGSGLLTARVFANRLWYLLFGRGLAAQLDDFGGQGSPPSHAALLDTLALDFVNNGWNVKRLVKQFVMSHTYRLSSEIAPEHTDRDPENHLFARQARFRLQAETIRDTVLAISGLLQLQRGGVSVKPYQPEGYYRHLNFPERKYQMDTDARQWRRGIYVHWQRQFLHPMLRAFDAPLREECTAQRTQSNTPSAALVLLNDPSFIEAARVLATKIIAEGGPTDEERIRFGFKRAVSRNPDVTEIQLLQHLLLQSRSTYRRDPQAAEALIQTGLKPTASKEDRVELAAWTSVARGLLNMHETITRN
jgi:hypothetical protein